MSAETSRPNTFSILRSGSRWIISDGLTVVIRSLKTKRQATQVLGEMRSYAFYGGTDHRGEKINGFDVGGRYGYFAVDERARGNTESSANARTVAADLTRKAARDLADYLNGLTAD